MAFEWIADKLDRNKIDLTFVLLNPASSALETYLKEIQVPVKRIVVRGKNDWLRAWWSLFSYLRKHKPNVIHCHLLVANILGLTAAWCSRIKSRIYTRHHSSLHHVYHKKGVIWDKLSNKLATKIISISPSVSDILINWENVPSAKIVEIPHGFYLEMFSSPDFQSIEGLRLKYNLENRKPVIGVISRFTEWKGVQYIIHAFQKLLESWPSAILFLLGAEGDYSIELNRMLNQIPEANKRIVKFEDNIAAAYHLMTMFVHVPVDAHSEAFGQIYIEALAAGVPSIFTLSGIAPDFVKHEENALVVPFKDSDAIYAAMIRILNDWSITERLQALAKVSVIEKFELKNMITSLEKIYEQ